MTNEVYQTIIQCGCLATTVFVCSYVYDKYIRPRVLHDMINAAAPVKEVKQLIVLYQRDLRDIVQDSKEIANRVERFTQFRYNQVDINNEVNKDIVYLKNDVSALMSNQIDLQSKLAALTANVTSEFNLNINYQKDFHELSKRVEALEQAKQSRKKTV